MKKLKMTTQSMTFEDGCNKYLEHCRQRNLREGTIRHYRQSYLHFYKYFDPQMAIEDLDFDNDVVYVNVTENRKPLIVPLNQTMVNILSEHFGFKMEHLGYYPLKLEKKPEN